ncbi:unnamed protein product [Toxocara canis]|uniref:Ovule protein n=1 Tax=Toxocara canis TaxID=6265 RepID=A0A183U7B0_TOXCA|nr:unnamed protein product [Toxocara canis]
MVESRRVVGGRGKKASPPFLSHEFIIQNHGDIMSCILMVVIVGLLFQVILHPSFLTLVIRREKFLFSFLNEWHSHSLTAVVIHQEKPTVRHI